jgi:hypothetical protein
VVQRLDRFVPGVHDSPALHEIVRALFTGEEAELAARMPLDLTTAPALAKRWRCAEADAEAATSAGRPAAAEAAHHRAADAVRHARRQGYFPARRRGRHG